MVMRYFLFFYNQLNYKTKEACTGIVSIVDESFPSHQSIVNRLYSNISYDNTYRITGMFEFKSKEDFCNFTGISINNADESSKSNNIDELWNTSPAEQTVIDCALLSNSIITGVTYLHKKHNTVLILDRIIKKGLFKTNVGECRIYRFEYDQWYKHIEYTTNELKDFRCNCIPIPFGIMTHLISTNFKDVESIRNHQHTKLK